MKKDTKPDITTGRKIVRNCTAKFWTMFAVCFRNRKRKKNTKNEWIDVKKDEKRLKRL